MLNVSVIDTPEMAIARKRELDIDRSRAIDLGKSALEAGFLGFYDHSGEKIGWEHVVKAACAGKVSINPDMPLPKNSKAPKTQTIIEITNETTLGASKRLIESGLKPLALNFANGKHPGGGFLQGARAQEENLCRSSALYHTLADDHMYENHRNLVDSSEWVIYSPDVPVFRTDDGVTLSQPWFLSFITCAAPNARSIGQSLASELLRKRIYRVLEISRAYNYSSLILGAWGCGAFGNDPWTTAKDFKYYLTNDFKGAFDTVVFAITDWSPERRFIKPFRVVFESD
jgi:uncharacterized protein (TIGR02452 family)